MKQTQEKRTLLDRVIKWPQAGIVLALIILYLILAFAPTPAKSTFFLPGNIINVVRQSAIMIVIGIPITFTLAAGLLDLSIGSLACLGAVVTCAFITGHSSSQMEICPQVPLGVAILIGMAVSAFFGWLNGRIITALNLPPFIVTLGVQEIAKGTVLSFTRGFPVSNLPTYVVDVLGRGTLFSVPYTVYLMAVLLAAFWIILSKTRFGRHVYAIGGNENAAEVSGVNVRVRKTLIYMTAGLMYAFAGFLMTGKSGGASASMGVSYELEAIAGCTIGGVSTTGGIGTVGGILIGVLVSYAVALVTGAVDFQKISEAAWLGIPLHKEAMGLFAIDGSPEFISALFTIIPIALATMMEHVGDIAAISATVGHNYINDPGLNRTLMGDGLATTMAGLLGGPANTTYGENTGVLALTKIYDPLVIRIAAVFAMILSFCPKFEAIINTIPSGIVGGISFVLYGMISAIGVRNVVENKVDFTNSRNLIIAAVILVCALGFNSVGGVTFAIAGVNINLSGLAIAAIAGILLNAILPGNDYEFDEGSNEPESASLRV